MDHDTPTRRCLFWSCLALAVIALVRVALLSRLSLTDNTESRYGSISLQMLRLDDWVTPWIYRDGALEPFWGKPPLEFWLVALSYKLFGVSEWAARLPNFLLGVAMVAATVFYSRRHWGPRAAVLAGVVLSTSILFFVLIGACVLDVPLAASVTAAMICFARFAEGAGRRRTWGLGFFAAIGVGMLAKGPVALVLVGLALGGWMVLLGRWRLILELPWVLGPLVFFAISAPWYYLAEKATPGFLSYFLINEHFLRYVSDNYGDRYGFGRKQPYGASWVMLAATLLPWTVLAVAAAVRSCRGRKFLETLRSDPWCTYALIWGLAPPVFFTLARQMLYTYLLPGSAGLAIAVAVGLDRWMASDSGHGLCTWLRWHFVMPALIAIGGIAIAVMYGASVPWTAAILGGMAVLGCLAGVSVRWGAAAGVKMLGLATTLTFGAAMYLLAPSLDERHSVKIILAEVYQKPAAKQRPIVMPFGVPCSADFYMGAEFHGRLEHHRGGGADVVRETLRRTDNPILVFKRKEWKGLKPDLSDQLVIITETPNWVACEEKDRRAMNRR